MNEGQELALSQVHSIAAQDPEAFQLVDLADNGETLVVDVSIDLRGVAQTPTGIDVRTRERFLITVSSDFPFRPPSVSTRHRRWADAPHVQWGQHLCLYQSPTAEWNPSDGMHGLLSRLLEWIIAAAVDALDPVGAPLHPPAVYPGVGTPLVIPLADAPAIDGTCWIGFAHLHEHHPQRVDLTGWSELGSSEIDGSVAGVVLLKSPLPHEYPTKLADLIDHLGQSISRNLLYRMLHLTHLYNPNADNILFVVGSPMRGTRGDDQKQHLAVWQVAADTADMFRMTIPDDDDSDDHRQLRHNLAEAVARWAAHARVNWCPVSELRPEVTQPRDSGSPLAPWAGKAVEVWGCGAIGSHLAEHLTRAGVSRIVLRDNDTVSPGVLLRQNFDDIDIGEHKTHALARRLRAIRPDLDVDERFGNLTTTPAFAADYTTADAIFDTTASPAISKRLEALHRQHPTSVTLVSMLIGHDARAGIATISPSGTISGPDDILRKTKLACSRPGGHNSFADEFWPVEPRTELFQPEPGCSDPTFTGSDAEVAALAAVLLDGVSRHLAAAKTNPAAVLTSLSGSQPGTTTTIEFDHDLVLVEPLSDYQIRISHDAQSQITSWINESARNRAGAETGGILFGERDDSSKICWVSHATGPPPDSTMSPTGFNCGTAGVDAIARALQVRSRDAARPIGMWHTHPNDAPVPSLTDLTGMTQIVTDRDRPLPKQLMLIVGYHGANRSIAGYLFDRHKAQQGAIRPQIAALATSTPPAGRIGLALSGGGSRAIAFHLGVMRALQDYGLLEHLDVISAVSGGSVIAAMWAWTDEDFAEFDHRVTELLRRGLMGDITRRTLFSSNTPRDLLSLAGATAASAAAVTRNIARPGRSDTTRSRRPRIEPSLRRSVTRTTAFEAVLAARLFGDRQLDQPARRTHIVINACELRTGTAFRFGTRESGSSRFGHLVDNAIPLAHAVAASAAYPMFLPAIDERLEFTGWDGHTRSERVMLTDGGVYDNLGTSCLLPGRSHRHSTNVHPVDFIIAADAGHGTLDDDDSYPMWWPTRTKRSFEAIYRKTQDSGRTILHDARAAGRLNGFAMPYLGQSDLALPWRPPDLVPRSAVAGYPTNFAKMTDQAIQTLSRRGEQLTRITVEHHCPGITSTRRPQHAMASTSAASPEES